VKEDQGDGVGGEVPARRQTPARSNHKKRWPIFTQFQKEGKSKFVPSRREREEVKLEKRPKTDGPDANSRKVTVHKGGVVRLKKNEAGTCRSWERMEECRGGTSHKGKKRMKAWRVLKCLEKKKNALP